MAEYLEREMVLKELSKNSITKKITLADGVSIYDTIKNLPSADVEEVVRCHECDSYGDYLVCDYMGCNGFCPYGKRKVVTDTNVGGKKKDLKE